MTVGVNVLLLFTTTSWVIEQENAAQASSEPTSGVPAPWPFTRTVIFEVDSINAFLTTDKPPRLSVTVAPAATTSDWETCSVNDFATGE